MGLFNSRPKPLTAAEGMARAGQMFGRALSPIAEQYGYISEENQILDIMKGADMSNPQSFTDTFNALLQVNAEAASEFKAQGMPILQANMTSRGLDLEQDKLQAASNKTKERRIILQNGIQYYADTGEPVLPNAPAEEDKPSTLQETFNKIEELIEQFGSYEKIPQHYLQALNIPKDKPSTIQERLNKLQKWKDNNYTPTTYELQALGITKEKALAFEKKLKVNDGMYPNRAKDTKQMADWKANADKILGGVTTSINLGGDDYYDKEAVKEVIKQNVDIVSSAEGALRSLAKTQEVLNLLDSGEANTGMFAEWHLLKDRLFATFGDEESVRKATSTEILKAFLGSDVFPLIKSLGIGARGLDTPAERDFLISVMTGDIKMQRESLRTMTEYRRELSMNILDKYNKQLKTGGLDRYQKVWQVNLEPITYFKSRPAGAERYVNPENGQVIYGYGGKWWNSDNSPYIPQ